MPWSFIILAGFAYGILLGPVFASALRATSQTGRRGGTRVIGGAWLSDWALAAAGWLSGAGWNVDWHSMSALLGWCGGTALLVIGIVTLFQNRSRRDWSSEAPGKKWAKNGSYVLIGFAINTLNPSNLLFWCGLGAAFPEQGGRTSGVLLALATVLGCNLMKIALANWLCRRMRSEWLPRLTQATGIFLVVCGVVVLGRQVAMV